MATTDGKGIEVKGECLICRESFSKWEEKRLLHFGKYCAPVHKRCLESFYPDSPTDEEIECMMKEQGLIP